MMKIRVLVICTLLGTGFLQAQEQQAVADTLVAHKVLLIPYDPRYYLSDADGDIMEQSHMEAVKFRSMFRQTVDRHVQRAVRGTYECISLLNDTADILEETLAEVMGQTGYKYEKAIPITPKPQEGDNSYTKTKNSNPKEHEDSKVASSYIPVKFDAMYMQAIVGHSNLLFEKLYEQHQADLFVFLTQFEIKTNYNSCMDIAHKIYRREVMLHFTIYDRQGRLIAGSYATSYFPSNSNNANKIAGDCFPELARYIAGCLP